MQTFLVVIQKTFLMRIYSSHLNMLCFFSRFYFFGHKYKGHDFFLAGAYAPVAPPSATRLVIYKFNSIVSAIKKLINIRQCFFLFLKFISNSFFFLRYLLNPFSLFRASSIDFSCFLILSRKARTH